MTTQPQQPKAQRANRRIVVACLGVVMAMTGMAYAAVPLYQIFCQVTGYGGTTQRSELLSDVRVLDRQITIRFDANIASDLNWNFKPVERKVTIKLGEQKQISFTAENLSKETITGTATFNVTPQYAGIYFNKIECFCFTETTLKPGEKIDMPVVFFIDPDLDDEEILNKLKTITLSYTMFREDDEETPVAAVKDSINRKTFN
jgi:cytochrome c oxidase assembly protein subunit 11